MGDNTKVFKVIVVGDSGVGKTCLTVRLAEGNCPKTTESTIGVEFREKVFKVDNENVKLQVWDTAGQDRFRRSIIPFYYRNAHAVVFVYDITKPSSFSNLSQWMEECENHHLISRNLPRILIGNKKDAVAQILQPTELSSGGTDGEDKASLESPSRHVVVHSAVAQRAADTLRMPFYEVSAKEDAHSALVDSIFLELAQKLKTSPPMEAPSYTTGLSQGDKSFGTSGFKTLDDDEQRLKAHMDPSCAC